MKEMTCSGAEMQTPDHTQVVVSAAEKALNVVLPAERQESTNESLTSIIR